MKAIKKIIVFVLAVALCSGAAGCSKNEKANYKEAADWGDYPVYKLGFDAMGGDDVMPVGAWWAPYVAPYGSYNGNNWPDYVTDYYYDLMKDCGINFVSVSYDNYPRGTEYAESVMKGLNLAAERDMGYFVYDSMVKYITDSDDLKNQIAEYIDHEACIGIHVQDEPYYKDLGNYELIYKLFKDLGKENKELYINLFPSSLTQKDDDGNPVPYEQYIKTFLELTGQKFYSWETYIYRTEDDGVNTQSDFFSELSTIRRVTNEAGVPAWMFVQAGGGFYDDEETRANGSATYPSEAETLWNINMGLAYGVKGVQYFTFCQAYEFGFSEGDGYNTQLNGLIGAAGNKNEWYYYVQKANRQIAAIDHILMNASSQGIIAVGKNANANILGNEKFAERKWREVSAVEAETDAVIGCFDYGGKTALYVVNHSSEEKQKIRIDFDDSYGFDVIQRAVTTETGGNSVTLTVEAGEGVLVVLK